MNRLSASPLRIARPSRDLERAERFWVDGLGLTVLARVEPTQTGEHRLVILGWPDTTWHLELVDDPNGETPPAPTEEDLIVLYTGSAVQPKLLERLVAAGGQIVPARNPYWDHWGITVADPDGYRLVLSHRAWAHDADDGMER